MKELVSTLVVPFLAFIAAFSALGAGFTELFAEYERRKPSKWLKRLLVVSGCSTGLLIIVALIGGML